MRTLVNSPAFDFDETHVDWGDVVLASIGWGDWQRIERALGEGLALVSDAEDRGERFGADALHRSAVALRRARGLLAGEDYLRWLAERSLSTEDVDAYLARAALRERAAGRPGGASGFDRSDPRALATAIRAEAILSGQLQLWAERLARCAAAARGLEAGGEEPPSASRDAVDALVRAAAKCPASGLDDDLARDRAARVAALQVAETAFSDHVVTRERIERCLCEHRLDWQRFVWEEVTFAAEGAAREAALWVREQGMGLREVASLAHLAANTRVAYSADVSELAGLLVAAAPGELVGPLAGEAGWRLVSMRERTPPAFDDAVLRARAGAELVEHALARHQAGRVRWHDKH